MPLGGADPAYADRDGKGAEDAPEDDGGWRWRLIWGFEEDLISA